MNSDISASVIAVMHILEVAVQIVGQLLSL